MILTALLATVAVAAAGFLIIEIVRRRHAPRVLYIRARDWTAHRHYNDR